MAAKTNKSEIKNNKFEIPPAEGRLGVLLVGLGAVSTTFIAGVEAIKRGIAEPVGSVTQMGAIRLGKRTENRVPLIKDFVPLARLEDLVFGASPGRPSTTTASTGNQPVGHGFSRINTD